MYDIVIVGAGIIGSFIAYDLSKFDLKVLVLDKENDVGNVTTMGNSAIVHTGYDPEDGTLKAMLNVEGARMYKEICSKLHVPYKDIGAYVVGRTVEEKATLDILKQRAIDRGVKFEEFDEERLHSDEKNLADAVKFGLSFPETAIIDPMLTAITLMDVSIVNGVELKLNTKVTSIENKGTFHVVTTDGEFDTKLVINAAGLGSAKIASMVNDNSYKIRNVKGEYFILDKVCKDFVNHIIYPVPTKYGKGVLVVPTVHGNIMLGPTSEDTITDEEINTTKVGLDSVKEKLELIVKNVPTRNIIRSFAGIRAKVDTKDFIIEESKNNKNFINLVGIDSPGIASAPAISKYVINNMVEKAFELKEKEDFEDGAPEYVSVCELDLENRNNLIKTNPNYGKIICRCEKISEQEVVNAIHRPVGATSLKAVKKRCRAGMGKCQGGFCQPLITQILERELHLKPTEVNYDTADSKVLKCSKGDSYEL
jgi:glycerol-3-phosphate dehydrogenase